MIGLVVGAVFELLVVGVIVALDRTALPEHEPATCPLCDAGGDCSKGGLR